MSEENQTSKNQDNHSISTSTMEEPPELHEESPSDQVRTQKIEDFDFFLELKDDLWDVKYYHH